MTWRTVTVALADLGLLRVAIAAGGGTITACKPCDEGIAVTYVVHA
jgi:hypothetical protein